jgi:hypothetical protein
VEKQTNRELAQSIVAELRKDLPQIIGGVQLSGGPIANSCSCDGYCGCNANCGCEGKGGCGCNANCPCDTKTIGGWNDWIVDPAPDVIISVLASFFALSAEQQAKVTDVVPILAKKREILR